MTNYLIVGVLIVAVFTLLAGVLLVVESVMRHFNLLH